MKKPLKDDQGFTFIEVIVSLLIMVVALVPMMDLFAAGRENYGRAGETTTAINLAQEKLEELKDMKASLITANPSSWISFSEAPSYRYQVEVTRVNNMLQLYKVEVRVQYVFSGEERVVSLSTYSGNR